jgi:Galactose oxidase, central domain
MNIVAAKDTSLYLFFNDKYSVVDIHKSKSDTPFHYINDSLEVKDILKNFVPCVLKDKIYFIESSGGEVYEFNQGQFKRIDYSFSHRMQTASVIFTYEGQILRYGGYGFFSAHNFFTFYNFTTNDWQVYDPVFSDELPIGTFDALYAIKRNSIYLVGGRYPDPRNRQDFKPLKEVWKFNLLEKRWKKLGSLLFDNLPVNAIVAGDKFIFHDSPSFKCCFFDPSGNKISIFKEPSWASKIEWGNPYPIYFDGEIYFASWLGETGDAELMVKSESEFFGDPVGTQKIYSDHSIIIWLLWSLSIGSLVVVALVGIQFLRKRKKRLRLLSIKGNHLYYQNKKVEFDAVSMDVIRLLLRANHDGVSGTELLTLTERKDLHNNHNIRERNNLLNEINFRIKTLLEIEEDIITSEKSSSDLRLKIYRIRYELFAKN